MSGKIRHTHKDLEKGCTWLNELSSSPRKVHQQKRSRVTCCGYYSISTAYSSVVLRITPTYAATPGGMRSNQDPEKAGARSEDKKWLQVTRRCLHVHSSSSSPLQRARSSEGTRGRSLGWQTAAPCHSPWPERTVTARAEGRYSKRREGEGYHIAVVPADLMNQHWQTQ